jgi:hypothetical protein
MSNYITDVSRLCKLPLDVGKARLSAAFRCPRGSAISSSSKKLEEYDIRAPIFGMGREVAI